LQFTSVLLIYICGSRQFCASKTSTSQGCKPLPAKHTVRDQSNMNKLVTFISRRILALMIALIYVGLGTLAVCSVYPSDTFYGDWSLYGLLITFPVSVISFGYRYADSLLLYPVFIIQTVMFIMTFFILQLFIKKNN
jgi:hypothetical protein